MKQKPFDEFISIELASARQQGIVIRTGQMGYFPWDEIEGLLVREGFRCIAQSGQNNQNRGMAPEAMPETSDQERNT